MLTKNIKRFLSGTVAAVVVAVSIPLVNHFSSAQEIPEGFVYADNGRFMCDGSPFYYGGTNCYYLTYKSDTEVKNVFENAKEMGLKVIRVWGNIDVGKKTGKTNSSGYPIFEGNNDGDGQKDGIYFQYFDEAVNRPAVNEGKDGLARLDYVIAQAEKYDMKLIITFTNYWEAFGGMGQYVKWYKMSQGQQVSSGKEQTTDCCEFYTNETIKGWYKDYIKTLLNHKNEYTGKTLKESPTVFSWELSNEPRCPVDKGCEDDILYNWAKEMSAYVKSLDPNHMVSVGDEGFYNIGSSAANAQGLPSYPYAGDEGADFEKLMSISTVDFGTPHMYVDQWGLKSGTEGDDDTQWIKRHAETTAALKKPIIFEEFGLTDKTKRDATYQKWMDIVTGKSIPGVEYQGFNYWMIASYLDDGSLYPDYDNYTVYGPTGTVTDSTRTLIMDAASIMAKKNIVNITDKSEYTYDRAAGQDVVINVTVKEGSISGVEFNGEKLSSSDYSRNGNTIKIKSSFLKKQELSKYEAKILMSAGNSPKFNVIVTDSQVPKPTIAPSDVTVDVNPKVCSDVSVITDKKTSEFRGLVYNGEKLTENVDYSVNGDTVIINASFIKKLPAGACEIIFDFYEGEDAVLNVIVTDTTGLDELDTFESYESDDDLWNGYTTNAGGNQLGLSLITKNGSQKLVYSYNVGGDNGYCGVNHPIAAKDMSGFDGIKLEIEGDGSGNSFTFQLRDSNDKYFEKEIKVDFTGAKTITIPFEEFKSPSWQNDSGELDTKKINQFSLYAGKGGSVTTGTYIIDDIIGYKNDNPDPYMITGDITTDGKSDVRVDFVLNGAEVDAVYNGDTEIPAANYQINGGQLMLKNSYISTLDSGVYAIVFKFSRGAAVLNLTVQKGDEPVHTHELVTETVPATCTEKGTVTTKCKTCDYTETKEIPALNHDMRFDSKVEATETTEGYTLNKCTRCGATEKTDIVAPYGHTHSYTQTARVEPTCTENGSVTYTCSGCGNSYSEIIAAKGHNSSDWIIDKEPTSTESGSKHTECTACGAVLKTEIIAPVKGDDKTQVNLFSGDATCGSWGQAVSLNTKKNGGSFDASVITKDGYIYMEYAAGGGKPEVILQSWSGAANWARVSPCEMGEANGHRYAKYSYSDMVSAFGSSDFAGKLDRLHIGTDEWGISVYSVNYVGGSSDNNNENNNDKTESDPYVSAFWGSASCGAWGQAVCVDTTRAGGSFNSGSITKGSYFYVEYSGDKDEIELILQSWSGGSGWAKVQAFESGTCNGHSYVKFSYDDCVKAYGSDFGTLDRINVGAKNGSITVYSVCCCYPQ